jgi:hypothetical protein
MYAFICECVSPVMYIRIFFLTKKHPALTTLVMGIQMRAGTEAGSQQHTFKDALQCACARPWRGYSPSCSPKHKCISARIMTHDHDTHFFPENSYAFIFYLDMCTIYMGKYVWEDKWVCECDCIWIYINSYILICIYTYIYVHIYIYTSACIHKHISIYIHIHTCVYSHMRDYT